MYRIDRRLLRMREASRCPTASNTRHQQRSVHHRLGATTVINLKIRLLCDVFVCFYRRIYSEIDVGVDTCI